MRKWYKRKRGQNKEEKTVFLLSFSMAHQFLCFSREEKLINGRAFRITGVKNAKFFFLDLV